MKLVRSTLSILFSKVPVPPTCRGPIVSRPIDPGEWGDVFFARKFDRVVVAQLTALVPLVTFIEESTSAINCVTTHRDGITGLNF